MDIKLGDRVRSRVSGFEGTVTATCAYLHGNTTYCVTASTLVDGNVKHHWFDGSELDVVE